MSQKKKTHTIKSALVGLAAVASIGLASSVAAAPAIGVNPAGTGLAGMTYTDLWTNATDSALAIGFDPTVLIPPSAPYDIRLISQTRVSAFQLNGAFVFPGGPFLNFPGAGGYEITKVLDINETVLSNNGVNANFGMATQTADVDATTAGLQQLAIFLDPLGDGSQAVPGNGAGTVRCYGTGPTACAGDGTLILSGHLVSNVSSFAASGAVGTGSFDLRFVIDFVNPAYLDIATGSIFGETITGTTNVPSFFFPDVMWNGVASNTGLLLKVDSSQSFLAPEPASVTLLGLGLLGFGATLLRRRRKS
jgi:hypothetical protein